METPLLNKGLYNRIRRHLPPQKSRRRVNDRLVISGILWVILTGSAWRQIPEFYGKWKTIYSRFRRWSKSGLWEKIFRIFAKRVKKRNNGMIDSTYLKAHRTASSCASGAGTYQRKYPARKSRTIDRKNRENHNAVCR